MISRNLNGLYVSPQKVKHHDRGIASYGIIRTTSFVDFAICKALSDKQ